MDLEYENGSKIPIETGSTTQLGRELGLGFAPSSSDRTISRHHLSLSPISELNDETRVGFEVIGKNPIWVCSGDGEGGRIYKHSEKGELKVGEKLSLSLKKPCFFVVKTREEESEAEKKRVLDAVERREKRTLERRREKEGREGKEGFEGEGDERIGCLDVSQIDPVKEFGFLVKGHEFDQYLKEKMLDIKNWNWFLDEEPCNNSEDDEATGEATSSKGKKKKGRASDDDEEWTAESEEEEEIVGSGRSTKRPKYSTRSKDPKRPRTDTADVSQPALKNADKDRRDEVEDDDEEDETIGGFIVDDVEEEEDEEEAEEELEEEFDDEEEEE